VIFDEAHHLEDVASEYFGVNLSRGGVLMRLGKLRSPKVRERGTVPILVNRLRKLGDRISADSIDRMFATSLPDVTMRVGEHFDAIEARLVEHTLAGRGPAPPRDPDPEAIEGFPGEAPNGADRRDTEDPAAADGPIQLRYKDLDGDRPFWEVVSQRLLEIGKELSIVLRVTDRAVQTLNASPVAGEKLPGLLLDLTSTASRFAQLLDQLERFRDFGDAIQVRWITRRRVARPSRGTSIEFGAAPVRVAEDLRTHVYDPLETVVLTSATLSVAGDPSFLADRLGLYLLDEDRFIFRQHPSPFDYQRQVLTLVPSDFPAPESRDYAPQLPEAIYRIVKATGGRTFVLFTSYSLLKSSYAVLERRLADLGLRPSAQGEAQRSELLRRFRAGVTNVLFATDSFWEGVDVKGRALECVIITRLPFRVPSEPIQEARLEDIQARGANPFTQFTIPQAVLKFKQGFGRLIRARTDRGIVVVLDTRILTKSYGKVFLRSLPETCFRVTSLQDLEESVEAFLTAPC